MGEDLAAVDHSPIATGVGVGGPTREGGGEAKGARGMGMRSRLGSGDDFSTGMTAEKRFLNEV